MKALCDHSDARPWLHIPIDVKTNAPTAFGTLRWCDRCGAGFADPMPPADAIPAHYDIDRYYTHGGAGHIDDPTRTVADRAVIKLAHTFDRRPGPITEYVARLHPGTGRSWIDVGCGAGTLLKAAADWSDARVGVDPDPRAVAAAAHATGAVVHVGSAEAMPEALADARFDVTTMTHVLEHCVDPRVALANMRRVTMDDGLFYCEVPNTEAAYFQSYAAISEMLDVPRHLNFFTRKSLGTLVRAAGFRPLEWRYLGYTRHVTPGWTAWENEIAGMLEAAGFDGPIPRRTRRGSLALIARTAFARPERKFDTIGVFARAA